MPGNPLPEGSPALDTPLRSLPIEVTVTVGKARPLIRELLGLAVNTVLPLDSRIDDPVEIWVGDRLVARGRLEEASGQETGQLAVRVTEVMQSPGGPT